jgi:hypothetical protein
MTQTRRSILGCFAAAIESAPAAAVLTTAPAAGASAAPLVGPITPDQYIAEMHAIGWRCFSAYYIGRDGAEIHGGVIEDVDEVNAWHRSEANRARRGRLLEAVGKSGRDFYNRTGLRLKELGLKQDVWPEGTACLS